MLTKKQVNLLNVFQTPFEELTFKQIKERSEEKSNNLLQLALKDFKNNNIILSKKIGSTYVHKLNLENKSTLIYLDLINQNHSLHVPILENIETSLKTVTPFFILIVFGSYAKNKNRKSSDLDVAILINDASQKKDIEIIMETIKRRELQKIDSHIITLNEFKEMLKADYENLAKQICKNNVVYYGYQIYVELLKWMTKQNYLFKEQKMN
jgi:predicted nucleotidyltransferase